ncbi:MFS transporter [Paenibacillus daejeonensis]|uniref:MFS transporter n=1 Tax=Paenibacillus daejeonensis TaxID=135193 RepID=UPI0004767B40|nr:MFS transporter [Paenibacillus daejeonensis]
MNRHQETPDRLWTAPFIGLTVGFFLLFLNLQMLLAAFPAYVKNNFQANDVTVSLMTSTFAAAAILARIATAWLLRRFDRRMLLYISIAIAVLMTVLYMYAWSVNSLLLLRVGYGIGFGMASTIIPTLVSRVIPGNRIGEGIAYFGLSTSLAMSMGPLIGLNVLDGLGFPPLVWLGTAVGLLIVPVLLITRAVPPQEPQVLTSSANHKEPFPLGIWTPALMNLMLGVTYSGLLSFIALFGEAAGLEQAGLFFLFNVMAILVVRPIAGKLFDAHGPVIVLVPAGISLGIGLILLSYTGSLPMLILSAICYGIGFGSIQPTLQAWMLRVSKPQQQGLANSMFYSSADFGIALGAFVLGAVASATDYAIMYRYSASLMIVFLLLSLWAGRRQRSSV